MAILIGVAVAMRILGFFLILHWYRQTREWILLAWGALVLALAWRIASAWILNPDRFLMRDAVFPIGISLTMLAMIYATYRITLQRAETRARLQDSEHRNRSAIESMAESVIRLDRDGRITHIWPNIDSVLGLTPDQAYDLGSVHEIFPGVELPVGDLESGQICEIEWSPERGPRAGRDFLLTVSADSGVDDCVYIASRDITDRKKEQRELAKALEDIEEMRDRLSAENMLLTEEIMVQRRFPEIVGESDLIRKELLRVEQVAETDTTVLVSGETGVGKELFVRAIHGLSSRSNGPFIKVNCAALPATLIESELFGHEKGSFTGAAGRKIGRFELAQGGTIFLDEIGELPLELQPKLLRILQEREFERVGGTATLKTDARIVVATNRDLAREVSEGRFRSDLYYRLNIFPINIPPLRERPCDVPHLVRYFLNRSTTKFRKKFEGVSDHALDTLRAFHWPGNVRQLENVIERAVLSSPGPILQIDGDWLNEPVSDDLADNPSSRRLEDIERAHILKVLRSTNWVIQGRSGAAEQLGVNPSTLRSRMKRLNLTRPDVN